MLFQQSGHWLELVSDQCIPSPTGDTFHASIMEVYDWGDRHPRDHSKQELAQWLTQHGGIDITHATLLEVFAECSVSGIMHNHPAMLGKRKQGALRTSTATQGATKRSLAECIQRQQLDSDLDKDTATGRELPLACPIRSGRSYGH
jgi:hypothetical protein